MFHLLRRLPLSKKDGSGAAAEGEDCSEPDVQPKGIYGDGASKQFFHNPVWIQFFFFFFAYTDIYLFLIKSLACFKI